MTIPKTFTDKQAGLAPVSETASLDEHAAEIRRLGKRVVADVIEIGRRLTEAKKLAGHGGWLPWLDREFGWSRQTADRFVQVFDASTKLPKLSNLDPDKVVGDVLSEQQVRKLWNAAPKTNNAK